MLPRQHKHRLATLTFVVDGRCFLPSPYLTYSRCQRTSIDSVRSMVDYPYDTPAASVKIKNITSCAQNRKTLHRIRNNDPSVTSLFLVESNNVGDGDCHEFYVSEGGDLGWLGYFIGENETLNTLYVHALPGRDQVEKFSIGMQRNKSIKNVEFWGDGLLGESLSAINLPHVTTLSMEECNLDHEKARCFAMGLRRCNSLVKYCGPMASQIVASLTALPMLENVRFRRGGRGGLLGECVNLPQVNTMTIMTGCNLDRKDFAVGLRRCKSLVTYCGPMTAEIVASLTALPMLENVEFWRGRGGLLGESVNLPQVTTMTIMTGCNFDRKEFHYFAVGLRRCKSLVTYYGPMTAEIVASLTALPVLESVRFRRDGLDGGISREERIALSGLLSTATTMKRLNLCYFGLGNNDLKVLAKGIACNASLINLDLSNNDIGNEGLQALASSLVGNTKLRELKLANNNIGDTGLEALEDSLARNRALRVLSIAGNTAITAGGLRSVSRILQSSGLEDLCLDRVNLTIAGAFPISINESLVSLSLSCFFVGFSIGDDGLRALALGLSYNSQLESLDLSGNSAITVSGLRSLNQYFGSPLCALKRLNLSGIDISDDCAHALADALDGNKSLKTLYFSERGITSNGWNAFLKLVCDPSSPNRTYLSNQTLCHLGSIFSWASNPSSARSDIKNWLKVNNDCQSPKLAAKFKILHCFPDLDMVPLFPWNLKLLPLLKHWFDETSSPNLNFETRIRNSELSSIYKFVRGLPKLVV